MSEIEFVDELPGKKTGGPSAIWSEVVKKLKANPGRWAEVSGYLQRQYGLEVAERKVGDDLVLYARWPKDEV